MNKRDVVERVSEKTGIEPAVCEKVIKAFEEQAGTQILNRIRGKKMDHTQAQEKIAADTGVDAGDCGKILTALDEALEEGLTDKKVFGARD